MSYHTEDHGGKHSHNNYIISVSDHVGDKNQQKAMVTHNDEFGIIAKSRL